MKGLRCRVDRMGIVFSPFSLSKRVLCSIHYHLNAEGKHFLGVDEILLPSLVGQKADGHAP